jgi:DNA-binding CsgD family transcriptional regulator
MASAISGPPLGSGLVCPAVPDDRLTQRQRTVLESIATSHPDPLTTAQLSSELGIAEGTLNVTLRSLRRRRLIAAVPASAHERGGWTLAQRD